MLLLDSRRILSDHSPMKALLCTSVSRFLLKSSSHVPSGTSGAMRVSSLDWQSTRSEEMKQRQRSGHDVEPKMEMKSRGSSLTAAHNIAFMPNVFFFFYT